MLINADINCSVFEKYLNTVVEVFVTTLCAVHGVRSVGRCSFVSADISDHGRNYGP